MPHAAFESEVSAGPTGSRKPESIREGKVKGSAASTDSVKSSGARR